MAGGFREELFRCPGVPSEPTAKPGSTSSSLLTMRLIVGEGDDGINTAIMQYWPHG